MTNINLNVDIFKFANKEAKNRIKELEQELRKQKAAHKKEFNALSKANADLQKEIDLIIRDCSKVLSQINIVESIEQFCKTNRTPLSTMHKFIDLLYMGTEDWHEMSKNDLAQAKKKVKKHLNNRKAK